MTSAPNPNTFGARERAEAREAKAQVAWGRFLRKQGADWCGVWDPENHRPSTAFGHGAKRYFGTPEQIARQVLDENPVLFGLDDPNATAEPVHVTKSEL